MYTALRYIASSVELKTPEIDQRTKFSNAALVKAQYWEHRPNEREPVKVSFVLSLTPDNFQQRKRFSEIESRTIEWNKETVKVRWIRDVRRKTEPTAYIEPAAADSPRNILNVLSNECLWQIFEQEVLGLHDICEIAQTCVRFNGVAKRAFRSKYRGTIIRLHSYQWSLGQCEVLFREFGKHIKKFTVFASPIFTDIVVGLVAKHSPNVTYLCCGQMDAITKAIQGHRRGVTVPFSKLETLICYLKKVSTIKLPTVTLPSLRRLMIWHAVLIDPVNVEIFFTKNNKLELLSLLRMNIRVPISYILTNLTELNSLTFAGMLCMRDEDIALPEQIMHIFQLDHLATFKWDPRLDLMGLPDTFFNRLLLSAMRY